MNAIDFGALLEDKEGASEKAYEKAISAPIFKVKYFKWKFYVPPIYFRNSFWIIEQLLILTKMNSVSVLHQLA